ncbi:nucleotide disphospho-sugar-binding domain-containing protein [Kutzneria sp. 744]|uniref:nucleotide disphospho-sugar-binding domain-containing protein n=1 Tax=Kutzneria sp. (strain 744) TaxID=345341 RepID=UPI0003EEB289|nr:nucleotide disphospho-sugar-binding domain-containing protein [Kutzneria sp. 744]EWM15941.1 glucosyltransferase [Kutzneria sp. 744]
MRILVTASPGLGHMLPMVPISWALRAAGHEVLLAMSGRSPDHVPMLAASGLHVVETVRHEQFGSMLDRVRGTEDIKEIQRQIKEASRSGEFDRLSRVGVRLFVPMSEAVADAVVELADEWRPDLVLHSPMEGAGPLAAAKLGIPAVEQSFGLSSPLDRGTQFAEALADTYRRHGADGPPERHVHLDVAPRSVQPEQDGWPMRYVPFNGGGQLPGWLTAARPGRPRIAVTLGTVAPMMTGIGPVARIAALAEKIDAEFVVALGNADTSSLGELPDNVRLAGYVPLGPLLATSAAVIHHGGAGTTLTALDAGVPQIIVPQGADGPFNAAAVAAAGSGLNVTDEELDAQLVERLLTEEPLRDAAGRIRAEMHAMPSPSSVADRLTKNFGGQIS